MPRHPLLLDIVTHPLTLSWCYQRCNKMHYSLFWMVLCANLGMINTKTKSGIRNKQEQQNKNTMKKYQPPINLMEMMYSKANVMQDAAMFKEM